MSDSEQFDFWYAVNNTTVLQRPEQRLETFGSTAVEYLLLAELMDDVNRIRVREGRINAHRPEIITPQSLGGNDVEGFGEEALEYLQWLRENEQDLVILKYGFSIRKDETNEHIVTDTLDTVEDRIIKDLKERNHENTAVIRGVDQPWEVCLMKLMVDLVQHSVMANMKDIRKDRELLAGHTSPMETRREIEAEFELAAQNPGRIKHLGDLLQRKGLFKQYEDRFFALLRNARS